MTKQTNKISAKFSNQIEALLDSLDNQEDVALATQLLHKRFFEKAAIKIGRILRR